MMENSNRTVLQKNSADRMIAAYFALFSASVILTVIGMLLTGGRSFTDTLFYNYKGEGDTFMDFYNSIHDAGTKEVYQNGVIYPPLANLFFYLLSKLIDPRLIALPNDQRAQLQADTTCRALLITYTLFCLAMIILLIRQKTKNGFTIGFSWGLPITLILSYPMIYCIQRGNLLLLSMALSMFFVFCRSDERKWIRELSLIALAVATGFKLYPAVLGLLLIRDKEYKRAVRLVVYGLIFTVLPFFFYDGVASMQALAANLRAFSDGKTITPGFTTTDVFATYISMVLPVNFRVLHWLLFLPTMAAAIVMFCLCEEEWKRVFCLIYLFMNINSSGQTYILTFLLIPFVLFLLEKNRRRIDRLYFLLFAVLLIVIPVLYYQLVNPDGSVLLKSRKFLVRPNQLLAAPAVQGMLLLITLQTVFSLIKDKIKGRSKKQEVTS